MRNRLDVMISAVMAITVAQSVVAANRCTDLLQAGLFPNTTVQKAQDVGANAGTGIPAYCEVTALISPVPGSKITAVYRLPDKWNGKMLGSGGGGWAGNIVLQPPRPGATSTGDYLVRGYATAQTDGGHASPNGTDLSWIPGNPIAMTDFSHRAIHEMTVLGKLVVGVHYGHPASKSYYQGCSTGGRMGLMETQRYPDDYDAVIAGAPVYTLLTQSSNVVRDQIFKAPGAAISADQIKMVNDAALAACDARDGLKDGVVTDPARCSWNPASLQCKKGESGSSCLSAPQVHALNEAYRTQRTHSGVVGNYALMRGGEAGWNPFVPTFPGTRTAMNGDLGNLVPLMFGNKGFDPTHFNIEKQQAAIHQTPFAAEYEASSPDLSKFFRRGGKLLIWHGMDDPGPSPLATTAYYERAVKANGSQNLRLFVLPGVYHCGNGPGADSFDALTALEQWSEKDIPPEHMVAKNYKAGFERPVCAWPTLPYYKSGDPASAASFTCR
jgi:feruloyl esterase